MESLCVCNTSEDSISIIDLINFKEKSRISLKAIERVGPHGICKYNSEIITANNFSNSISKVNIHDDYIVSEHFIGMNCNDVKIFEDKAFIICGDCNNIICFDLIENKVIYELPCGDFPHSIAMYNQKIVTADMNSDSITVYDSLIKNGFSKRVGAFPTKAVFNEDGKNIIVCESNIGSDKNGTISVHDTDNLNLLYKLEVGNCPVDLCVNNNICFVSNYCEGTLSILDLKALKEINKIYIGGMPRGVIKKDLNLYVGDSYKNRVCKVSLDSMEIENVAVGKEPTALLFI